MFWRDKCKFRAHSVKKLAIHSNNLGVVTQSGCDGMVAAFEAPNIRRISRSATLIALTMASAGETWTTSGVSLTLTDLTGTLSASSDEASWALTVYMSAFAISVALSHRLSLTFGNRRLLSACALLYALSSVGCAFSTDLRMFLLFRALAGFAGGVFLVRSFVFFTQQYAPPVRAKPLISYAIAYFLIGRLLSPIVCGWLADVASWRDLFVIETVLMLVASWLFYHYTADHWIEEDGHKSLDYAGIMLLVLGAVGVQTVLSRGEIDDWFGSPMLLAFFVAGVAGNCLFVFWQLSRWNRHPLLDLASLSNASARAGAVLGFGLGILLAGSLYVIPQYLRNIEGHSASQTGLLLSIGGGTAVVVLCCFRTVIGLLARLGGGSIIAFSLLVEIVSQLLFAHYLTPDTPDRYLWLPLALNGVFIALSVPTLGIVAFAEIKNDQTSNARAMYYGCRQLGASIGVTCAAVLIDRRMSLHSARLLDSFVGRDVSIIGRTASLTSQTLASAVRRQSSVLSYADVFYAMTLVALITLFFVPLLPSVSAAPRVGLEDVLDRADNQPSSALVGASK